MAAAIPFALKAAPYIGSAVAGLFGRKASGPSRGQRGAMEATQRGGEELSAAARPLLQQGQQLAGQGAGYLQQGARALGPAAQYYQNILGSRRSATEALAPETTSALEYYRGAEGKTRRTMRGGARDYALAELDRQKVGQIAGFLPSARRAAAEGATGVGQAYGGLGGQAGGLGVGLSGQGIGALGQGAYLQSGLFDQASRLREQEREGGKGWGSFIYDILSGIGGGRGGGRALLPSRRIPGLPTTGGPAL